MQQRQQKLLQQYRQQQELQQRQRKTQAALQTIRGHELRRQHQLILPIRGHQASNADNLEIPWEREKHLMENIDLFASAGTFADLFLHTPGDGKVVRAHQVG